MTDRTETEATGSEPEGDPRSGATLAAEEVDAHMPHSPGRPATADEEEAAERARRRLEESGEEEVVTEHYREMTGRGAAVRGEGEIT